MWRRLMSVNKSLDGDNATLRRECHSWLVAAIDYRKRKVKQNIDDTAVLYALAAQQSGIEFARARANAGQV